MREWVIVKRLATASLALSSCLPPFLHLSWRNPGLEILLRLTPCPIPRTHAPALTSAYPRALPRASTPYVSSHPSAALSTQPPVPSTLCLVRWWRHLVQFNKRRSIMTSASELPLSSLTLADSLSLFLLIRPSTAWPRVLTPSTSLSLSHALSFTYSLTHVSDSLFRTPSRTLVDSMSRNSAETAK